MEQHPAVIMHDEAMNACGAKLFLSAFHFGLMAINYLTDEITQPSRGIIYRSVSWVCIDAGEYTVAKTIASWGLMDDDAEGWLKRELEEVLDTAIFESTNTTR